MIDAYELCDDPVDTDELDIIDIIDIEQEYIENWEWAPNEEVTIEIEVKNANFTERDFQVELFFLDENNEIKENFTTSSENLIQTISLDEGERGILNFTFKLDEPEEGEAYYLYAKFYDDNNETICTSLKAKSESEEATITIEEESKIIFVRAVSGPTEIIAGSKVEYTVEVINLGNVKESKVLVVFYNADLKIRETREITDLEIEKSQNVTFNFTLPQNTSAQSQKFSFSAEYDYNEENGNYYEFSEKSKIFSVQINASTSQATETNQTENQITELIPNQTTQTNQTENNSENTPTPYLWPIIITFILITLIIIGTFLFLKYGKRSYTETPSDTPTPASVYVKKIQTQPTA